MSSNHSNAFNQLVSSYSDVIVSAYFGHTHDDEFVVMSGGTVANPIPAVVGYVPGTVNPQGNHNPAFRIYDVDAVTGNNNMNNKQSCLL